MKCHNWPNIAAGENGGGPTKGPPKATRDYRQTTNCGQLRASALLEHFQFDRLYPASAAFSSGANYLAAAFRNKP